MLQMLFVLATNDENHPGLFGVFLNILFHFAFKKKIKRLN
jgi:hypothetical protein